MGRASGCRAAQQMSSSGTHANAANSCTQPVRASSGLTYSGASRLYEQRESSAGDESA